MAFTIDKSDENKQFVNPVQEIPNRLTVYSVNRCEDQVIGFEFITKQYQSNPRCCGSAIVNLCVPIEVVSSIDINKAEFYATDDPCYKDWIIKKIKTPELEIQRDSQDKATGILVRFSSKESCCYPLNMGFRLYGYDSSNCKFTLSSGLLIFK